MNKKKDSGLSQGYKSYSNSNKTSIGSTNNDLLPSIDSKKQIRYPKGYMSVFLISIITIAIFLANILIKREVEITKLEPNKYSNYMSIQNGLTIGVSIGLLLHLFWFMWRQNLSLKSRYASKQMVDIFTIKNFRERKNLTMKSLPWNSIKNFDDYKEYCSIKKKTTALTFYISTGIYTLLFIISLIILFVTKPLTIG